MNLLTTTLTDVISQIAKSIQITTLIPASILVLSNVIFIFPALGISAEYSILSMSLLVVIITTISYLLWLWNGPIIRLFEGYPFYTTSRGQNWVKNERSHLEQIESIIKECEKQLRCAEHWLKNILPAYYDQSQMDKVPEYQEITSIKEQWQFIHSYFLEKRLNHFPPTPGHILPTRLGNTLAAFEAYPSLRYGIEGPIIWPRMVPVLEKNGFSVYVEREKAGFDFLLNLIVILSILGIQFVATGLALFGNIYWILAGVFAISLTFLLHHALIQNAVYWGTMTKVAFDLFRHDLRKSFMIRDPESLEDERDLWRSLSAFLELNEAPIPADWVYRHSVAKSE